MEDLDYNSSKNVGQIGQSVEESVLTEVWNLCKQQGKKKPLSFLEHFFRTFWDVWKLQMLELWKGNWEFDPYVLEMPLPTAKLFLENRTENRRTTAKAVINTGSPWWCKDLTLADIKEWLLPSGYYKWRNHLWYVLE